MSKSIPVELQSHYDEAVNTTCLLLRVDKNVGINGTPGSVYMAVLDTPVTYDDGDGVATYSALGGWQPSSLFTGGDLGVDNAEAECLIPAFDLGPIVEEDIRAGRYDDAEFRMYRVNWKDLTAGRHELVMYGTIGQVRTINGLSCFAELRGPQHKLKQSCIGVTSVTCRVRQFGSQAGEEPYPCGVDLYPLWFAGSVTAQGAENDRAFEDQSLGQASGYWTPGAIQWLTGDNFGLTSEVESHTNTAGSPSGAVFSLRFPTPYAIQIGDTYQVRKECTRQWSGNNSCDTFSNRPNFRGEPFMPLADQNALGTPGAIRPGANTGIGVENPMDPQ